MKNFIFASMCCLIHIAGTGAQNQSAFTFRDKGLLVITLGNDTTFIHEYKINGLSFESRILTFIGGLRYLEGKGQFDKQGNMFVMESTTWQYGEDKTWNESGSAKIYSTQDSTIVEATRNGIKNIIPYAGKFLLTNSGDAVSFQLFPFLATKAPAKIGDSIVYKHVNAIGSRDFVIKRIGLGEVLVRSHFMGPIRLFVDKNNKLQHIDALGSSLNFTAKVYRNRSLDPFKKAAEKGFNAKPPLTISTRDTVTYRDGDQNIEVVYWQPSARGRKIFDGIVPNNKFWRFGANNATKISLAHHLKIGNSIIPKGVYALFAVPGKDSWTLKFNSRANVWGTEYDPAFDVASIPLTITKLTDYVDTFQITIEKIRNHTGRFLADWELTRLSFDFENFIMSISDENVIRKQVIIADNSSNIWQKWASNEGLETFFAPETNMVLESGGPFEIYFFPDNAPGLKGAEGTKVLAYEEGKMISFTWDAPPVFPEIRKQKTFIIVRLIPEGNQKTIVTLEQIGFGNSPDWITVANYFDKAWETVLGRLKYSVEKGPVDWKNPPNKDIIRLN